MLLDIYGIEPEINALPGYEDLNYLLILDLEKSVLKITTEKSSMESVRAQTRVLEQLGNAKELSGYLPELIPGSDGRKIYDWSYNGETLLVRRLSFLEGTFMAEAELRNDFYSSLGKLAGIIDRELFNIDEAVFKYRRFEWDLAGFGELKSLSKNIDDPYERTMVEYFFMKYNELVAPIYPQLRKSLIHNDFNDWNILTKEGDLSGLIDFGDMVVTASIHELAIALAYCLMEKEDPLAIASEVIQSYNLEFRLNKEELDILYYLIAARLCTTVLLAARKSRDFPDDDYYQVSAGPAWHLLHKWIRINPVKALNVFYGACGMKVESTGPATNKIRINRKNHMPGSLSLSYNEPIHMVGSSLQYMYDDEGNTYLDCVNNIAHVGHCHPKVVEAGQRQMAKLNTNTRYLYDSLNNYASRLLDKFPAALNKVIFVNSGSEATDLAIRLAQTHTGRDHFIVLDHAYHGNNRTAISLSPYKFNHKGGPGKSANVHIAPIPDPYRGPFKTQDARRKTQDIRTRPRGRPDNSIGRPDNIGSLYANEVRKIIESEKLENRLAAFIAESIPGCAGQILLPDGYLEQVYSIVRKAGGVCIADEVQTGFGRVGDKYWAFELQDVIPDIVILGKPMGNGHPMGAVVFTEEIAASFDNGLEFFSSFGGNPVSCEIGLAVLDAIENDRLQENALITGKYLIQELMKLQSEEGPGKKIIGDIRGAGLFIGIEIVKDREGRIPDAKTASLLVNKMKERRILLSTDGPDENIIKFKPPLCFKRENAMELLSSLRSALKIS
jgi:4-aminobutyrate aminotransferase-like enzyme